MWRIIKTIYAIWRALVWLTRFILWLWRRIRR